MHRLSRPNGRSIARIAAAVVLGSLTLLCVTAEPVSTAINRSPLLPINVSRARLAMVKGQGPYAMTPERRALLNTIRYAEGTWTNGEDRGYRILYGGGEFQDLSRHPEKVVSNRYTSAAAGAYQFLPATWKGVAKELKLRSFEPAQQDQAALHLVKRRGALSEIDRRGLTPAAMARLAPEWSSFPTWSGHSAYGQPVKSHQELASFYSDNLQKLKQQQDA
ncbi:MAG: muramidase [Cyanobacteriota bacterium]|nr:muramidase [Cyanobacteriota bacterium]